MNDGWRTERSNGSQWRYSAVEGDHRRIKNSGSDRKLGKSRWTLARHQRWHDGQCVGMLSTEYAGHRLVAVRDWVTDRQETFKSLLGRALRETDCSDDRLAIVLTLLGRVSSQQDIDDSLLKDWNSLYALPRETIRLDSTTVQVYHDREAQADSVMQFGFSHDGREVCASSR